jgi:hypothetical protein
MGGGAIDAPAAYCHKVKRSLPPLLPGTATKLKRIRSKPAVAAPFKKLISEPISKALSRLLLLAAALATLSLPIQTGAGWPALSPSAMTPLACYLVPLGPQYQAGGAQRQPLCSDLFKDWHAQEPFPAFWADRIIKPGGSGARLMPDSEVGYAAKLPAALAERPPPNP